MCHMILIMTSFVYLESIKLNMAQAGLACECWQAPAGAVEYSRTFQGLKTIKGLWGLRITRFNEKLKYFWGITFFLVYFFKIRQVGHTFGQKKAKILNKNWWQKLNVSLCKWHKPWYDHNSCTSFPTLPRQIFKTVISIRSQTRLI